MQIAIKELMSKDPARISTSAKLNDALGLMKNKNLSHIIVTDDNNKLQGIISKTDIQKHLIDVISKTTGKTYTKLEMNYIPVSEVMSQNPIYIDENQTVKEAIILLADYKINSLPVVNKGIVSGIITAHDIINYLYNNLEII